MHKAIEVTTPQLCVVTLLGNLVAAPEIRYRTNPVSAITEIVLATRSQWLDKKTKQTKEWTTYHHVIVEGDLVEEGLLHANKGDIILVSGYLNNIKNQLVNENNHRDIVHAIFVQKFTKHYTQSINKIQCSGRITALPQLNTTLNNKLFSQVNITINQQVVVSDKQGKQCIPVIRELHLWGQQAQYLVDKAEVGDNVIIEGKLSYLTSVDKSQYIEGKMVSILKD